MLYTVKMKWYELNINFRQSFCLLSSWYANTVFEVIFLLFSLKFVVNANLLTVLQMSQTSRRQFIFETKLAPIFEMGTKLVNIPEDFEMPYKTLRQDDDLIKQS